MRPALTPDGARVTGHALIPIEDGWEAAPAAPDERLEPDGLVGLTWIPATAPGTAAAALRAAGAPIADLDGEDWWFRTSFAADPVGSRRWRRCSSMADGS